MGRPNVGKSTLFNRLLGGGNSGSSSSGSSSSSSKRGRRRGAIVSPVAGTTRDRREGRARLAGLDFVAVDTGGLDDPAAGVLNAAISEQVRLALEPSPLALFVIDAREGEASGRSSARDGADVDGADAGTRAG